MVLDKLYVSYLEDGRNRQLQGDIQGARQRYEQAARYDPDRGVAQEMLAELDKQADHFPAAEGRTTPANGPGARHARTRN